MTSPITDRPIRWFQHALLAIIIPLPPTGAFAQAGGYASYASPGKVYGPWTATGTSGSNNAKNVNWNVSPNVTLPLGFYTIVDSSQATWSQNAESKGCGFAKVWGK